jgi:hypothetical protein
MKNLNRIALLSACLISSSVMAQVPGAAKTSPRSNPWSGSVQAGAGYWLGDATYSIGGEAWTPQEGNIQLPDKLSELKFPLDVAYGSLGGNLFYKGNIEFFGTIMGNLTDPSSKMEDSDWGIFDDSGSLDIYSESDAELTALSADLGARYWFHVTTSSNRFDMFIGFGPSLLIQHLDWTISNVDQWYPSRPQMPHDTQSGVVATYTSDIVMAYFNACAKVKFKQFTGRVECGIGPAFVQDEDDHILRQKRSTADMFGAGAKGAAELRYDLTKHLFALARMEALSIVATGTSKDKGYGGDLVGYYAEIDEEFALTSLHGGLAIGCNF